MTNPTADAAHGLLRVRVSHREVQAEDVVALTLVPIDEAPDALPAFDAGAHIDLHLPNGLVRQYSLCNAPHERGHYLVAVLREPAGRGGSACVHEALLDADACAALRAAGIGISVWGANHEGSIRRMLGLGVDLLATDDPPLAVALRG